MMPSFYERAQAICPELNYNEGVTFDGPTENAAFVIYTTKFFAVERLIANSEIDVETDVLGRYGIPSDQQLESTWSFIGNRQTIFLGDCDPIDLLVYTFLSERIKIDYFGVSDLLLWALGTKIENWNTIELLNDELEALELLKETKIQYENLMGSRCYEMLKQGRKLEVEGAVNFAAVTPHKAFAIVLPRI